MFSCFTAYLGKFVQVAFEDLFPSTGLHSKENETPWFWKILSLAELVSLFSLECLDSMLKDTDIYLKIESDAVWLSLWTGKGQKEKILLVFFFLSWFYKEDHDESFNWVFLFIICYVFQVAFPFPPPNLLSSMF